MDRFQKQNSIAIKKDANEQTSISTEFCSLFFSERNISTLKDLVMQFHKFLTNVQVFVPGYHIMSNANAPSKSIVIS